MELREYTLNSIQSSMRAINAISAVLIADDSLDITLGAWMRGGLVEAIHALSFGVTVSIEEEQKYAKSQGTGAAA